jgi:regulation of enolase protein 1 (concanavalin A-like superfamily)
MQWLNEPPSWREEHGQLTVRAAGKTDFWRKTHDGGIRDHGHFYFDFVDDDFAVRVQVSGQYRDQYDQAGLMVRWDEANWLKCGVELKDGVQCASVVVTRDWSDWSVVELDDPESMWLAVQRQQRTIEVSFSLDGKAYRLMRQTCLVDAPRLAVGPMIAAPKGDGFVAVFQDFTLQRG